MIGLVTAFPALLMARLFGIVHVQDEFDAEIAHQAEAAEAQLNQERKHQELSGLRSPSVQLRFMMALHILALLRSYPTIDCVLIFPHPLLQERRKRRRVLTKSSRRWSARWSCTFDRTRVKPVLG